MQGYDEKYVFNFFVDSPEDIKTGTRQIMRRLLDCMVEADYMKVDRLLKESKGMRYSIQGYVEDASVLEEVKDNLVSAGYASALMDAMQLYVEKMNAQNEILKINTKYRDTILSVLKKRGTLLHGDLASSLGVSPSGLNAIIKQMNGTSVKLIAIENVSKYKLYSLTPVAYQYIIKQEQEYFPGKDTRTFRHGVGVYTQTSKYREYGIYDELYIESRNKEENESIELRKRFNMKAAKYDEKASVNNQILKFEKKLA